MFFRRALYRPFASFFPYAIFILPALFMVFWHFIGLTQRYPYKLDEMEKVTGVITKVYIPSRGWDYIYIKDKTNTEKAYRSISISKELEKKLKQLQNEKKVVMILYANRWLLTSYRDIEQLTLDGEFLTVNNKTFFQYNYKKRLEKYKTYLPNLIWWLEYSLFGFLWLWWLNKKELPIHRVNKIRFYKKNRLKDK